MKRKIDILRKKYKNKFFVKDLSALCLEIAHVIDISYSNPHKCYLAELKILYLNFEFDQETVLYSTNISYALDPFLSKYKYERRTKSKKWIQTMKQSAFECIDQWEKAVKV